jgi:nucleotide-binding universal stress UspA family protein
MYSTTETDQSRKRDKQEYLRDVADRIEYTHAVASETIFIESIDLEDSLVRATSDADLVVIASRRRGFLLRLFSYSVTDQLRRRLRVPTLFVRGRATPVDLTADPIARHILIPLDGSALAERILGPASAIGRLAGATFTLLNVQDQERTNGVFEHTNPPGHLIAIAGDLKASASAVDAHAMTTDQPLTSALTSFAEGRKVDLIALATRSDGGITRLLRGSITDKLIRRTDIPILQWNVDVEEGRPDVTTVVE